MKRRGVEAFSAKDIGKLGLTDEEQIEVATKKQAIIFTHDVDFLRIAHPQTTSRHNLCPPAKANYRGMHKTTKSYCRNKIP